MKITLDSNAWEKIFDLENSRLEPIRAAFKANKLSGYVCEIAFKIETVEKQRRPEYFESPKMSMPGSIEWNPDGTFNLRFSIGPDNSQHPGLPSKQIPKLYEAIDSGIKLLRNNQWMGLPSPIELIENPEWFVSETSEQFSEREIRASNIFFDEIVAKGYGKADFDKLGGWDAKTTIGPGSKAFERACAEWVDGEIVTAHLAYKNDILCTDDRARASKKSIFNEDNRKWLREEFSIRFMTVEELLVHVQSTY